MKTWMRWFRLTAIVVPVVVLGGLLWSFATHLRPVTTRVLPANNVITCNADGFPVLEDEMDPSFKAPMDSYQWNRPLKTVRLDAYCRPGKEVPCGEVRTVSPSGDLTGWLEYSRQRGDGHGAGSIMLQEPSGNGARIPADYLPGDMFHDGPGFTEMRSYPRLQVLDNRYSIVLGDRSALRNPQGKVLLKFESNDYKTQFFQFSCNDPRYVPLVHGVNLWTEVGTPRFNSLAKYALYDTQTRTEIALPDSLSLPSQMLLVRDDYLINIPFDGEAVVIERATGKRRKLGTFFSTWGVTQGGDACWTDYMRDKKHLAVLQWKTGKPTMHYTRIPAVLDPAAHYKVTLRRDGELAATAISHPKTAGEDALAGRRMLTLYRHSRRAGTFTVPYHGETTLDYTAERLAFSPDGRTLAWLLDTGDGNRSLYAFTVE